DKDETRSMRTKEDAHDYRYFPDPDLPPLIIEEQWINSIREKMPELPASMRQRFQQDLGLSAYDAAQLTVQKATADYFEAIVAKVKAENAKIAANWVTGEL